MPTCLGPISTVPTCTLLILRYADLQNANLQDADLKHAEMQYANLTDADLTGADMHAGESDHFDTDLKHATWTDGTTCVSMNCDGKAY